MLDRLINLFTLLIAIIAVFILIERLHSAWNTSEAWEQEWVIKAGTTPAHSSERLLAAIRKANELGEYQDAKNLERTLEVNYKPSGIVFVRFTSAELVEAALAAFIALLFAVIPISINYVRHGKARIWNRGNKQHV